MFSLKIGGHKFAVKMAPNLIRDRGRYGEVNFRTNEISIDVSQTAEKKSETILHEIIEVIDGLCELDLSHSAIKTLTFGLHQALRDNKLEF